jgi:sugar phosphate isomerase/epimerase
MWNIGFVSATLNLNLEALLAWCDKNGFPSIEIAGAHATFFRADYLDDIKEMIADFRVKISALGCFLNYLDPNPEVRKRNFAELENMIEVAHGLNVNCVTCFVGQNNLLDYDGNVKLFKEEWIPRIELAQKKNVNIAIENCPAKGKYGLGGGNLMTSPAIWGELFQITPKNFGLNLDPSHLHWQLADPVLAVEEFADRIFHVHIKDTQIFKDRRDFAGIYGNGNYVYRLPGRGEIDWKAFLGALKDNGYTGTLSIEHEDPDYYGSEEKKQEALLISKKYLEQFF